MERKAQRLAGVRANGRVARAAWLATTALTAILFSPGVLRAQSTLPADTTPQGGVVVGGSATITQGAGSTTIDQSSQRTAINWQSFNVGSAASVQFNQPSSTAIALNRVVTSEPSVIAGKINANGQIVLVNQSGVVFTKGSQVNAESIVVSTANVATKDFMAGKLVFSGTPKPGAKIVNDGQLTAGEAGLVGLVAPQVANNGVITARLGQVVLAGARAFTLDLYGDRLVSLDVTQAVRAVDVGGKLVPALVTNSGLILADGGKVTLTAQDADALVTQLINAGGTIRANTVGANTGTISIQGVGGDIQIAGNLLAQGTQAGSKGGAVEALTTGTVSVAPGAVINASGDAGGGVVALGTDLQRAMTGATDTAAPRAAAVVVAAGATVKADATGKGNGGTVTLLSAQATHFAGAISAQGGPQGGNGGMVEISSDGVISLGGTVIDTALDGQAGEILLDPQTLIISTSGTSSGQTSYVDPASLVSLTGSIVLSATKLVDVASAVNLTAASALTLSSGGDVTIGASIDTVGSLEIDASGTILVGGGLTAGNIALLDPGTKTFIDIGAPVVGSSLVEVESGGGISETAGGVIATASLVSGTANSGNDLLDGANSVTALGAFTLGGGTLSLADAGSLNVAGVVSAADAIFEAGGGITEVTGGLLNVGTLSSGGTTIGGDVLLMNGNGIGTLGNMALSGTHVLAVADAGSLNVAGVVHAATVTLSAATLGLTGSVIAADGLALEAGAGGVTEASGGLLTVGTLSSGGTTIGGAVSLGSANDIGTLGAFAAAGNILLHDSGALAIAGLVQTPGLLTLEDGGAVSELGGGLLNVGTLGSGGTTIGGDVLLMNGNGIGTLGNMALSGTHVLAVADAGSLNVAGVVNAATVTLSAATLGLTGSVIAAGGLALEAGAGGVTEASGGLLNVGTLGSGGTTIGGAVSLGSANDIGTLGAFAAAGDILLHDSGALAIAGLVQTPGLLTLEDGGAVSELGGGLLNVGTLNSGGTTIGGDVQLTNFNGIGTLGNLLTAGNLTLDNAGSLTMAGPVQANMVTLVDNGVLTLGGLLQATGGQAVLVADGLLEAAGGAVSVGGGGTIDIAPYTGGGVVDLGGTAVGGLELSSQLLSGLASAGTIVIGRAGGFSAGSIYTEGLLILSNPVLVLDAAGPITQTGGLIGKAIDVSASSLTLNGGLEANTLNLVSSGGITQSGAGELYVGTLSSGGATIGGDVALNGSLNSVFTLGGFDAAGNFALTDGAPLVVDGPVKAANIALNDGSASASSLAINGTLAAGSGGTISLIANSITSSGASITVPGGTVAIAPYTSGTAVDLGGTAAGLDLSGALLGAVSGSTALVDISTTGSIATDGVVSVAAGALRLSGNGVGFNGTLAVPGALELASTNGVTTASGESLSVGTLLAGGAISGPVNMALGNNDIGTLGAFSLSGAGNDLALSSQTPLVVSGALNAGNISLNADGLTLASVVNAGSAVTLNSGAGVVEASGGAIDAPSLTTGGATVTGAVLLGGGNSIGMLSGLMASGDVLVNDAGPLSVTGGLTGANITLDAAGLTFASDVATPGLLALASSGGVAQTAGTISAATLSSDGGTIAGGVDIGLPGNAVQTISGFAAGGDVSLADAGTLSVAGPLSAANITLSAAGIAVDGGITTGVLQLASSAGVSEGAAGQVTAATLTTGGATIAGDAVLNMAGNRVGTLGGFAATGGLTLNNATDLTLAGPVTLGGTLALLDTGNITQTGGGIMAAALTSDGGTIGGNALFGAAGNAIPVLGAFAAGGDVLLNDTGALNLAGNISAGNMLGLDAGGAITQGSGIVSAALLNASGTALTLPDANVIGALGSVTTSGDISAAGVNGIAGPVSANNATLSTTGNFTQTGDARISNALYVTAGGNVSQNAGSVSAQTATISAGGSMSLSGTTAIANEVDLIAASSITHAAGSLSAATLVGAAGTLASFGAYTNIGTLGSFIMHDSLFALANAGPLTIVGPVVANTVTITAQGPVTLAGSATGGLFITGTIASSTTTAPSPLDSVISSTGSAAAIQQTGTFLVNYGANALTYLNNASQPATLFLYTQPSGTMNFAANTNGSLYAPSLALVLAAGASGVVTGNVNLQHLEVLSALSVNLNGTIAGIPGPTAAGGGTAFPFPQSGYRFNTCPIGSVNCTILPIELPPEGNPLQNFDIAPRKRKRLDHGVQLPGIATRDF